MVTEKKDKLNEKNLDAESFKKELSSVFQFIVKELKKGQEEDWNV
jgi:hypothetical protein